jgi:creatinine amidohydrolase
MSDVYDFSALTWPEARDLAAAGAVVLLPTGSTEAHGPHLPLATDTILSEELACRAGIRLADEDDVDVIIAPPLHYGVTEFASPFAGTVGLRPETLAALVEDVCASLAAHGFQLLVCINNHLEPAHITTLKQACEKASVAEGFQAVVADNCEKRWARTLTEEFKSGACHAGQYETSLVLASRPETVKEETAAALPPNPESLSRAIRNGAETFVDAGGPDAYFGYPADGTVDEGNATYDLLTEMVVTVVREARSA